LDLWRRTSSGSDFGRRHVFIWHGLQLGDADPVSRRMFEEILKDEEDHADDISDLLYTVDPKTGKTVEQFTGDSVSKRFEGS
jgi:hypothetical protein